MLQNIHSTTTTTNMPNTLAKLSKEANNLVIYFSDLFPRSIMEKLAKDADKEVNEIIENDLGNKDLPEELIISMVIQHRLIDKGFVTDYKDIVIAAYKSLRFLDFINDVT